MISNSGTIRDLCDEIEKVAREEFGEWVSLLNLLFYFFLEFDESKKLSL